MGEPVSVQILLNYLAFISIPVGVFYHIMTLRNAQRNQQIQVLHSLWQKRQQTERMLLVRDVLQFEFEDYAEYRKKYNWYTNPEDWAKLWAIGNMFDGIGFMAKKGTIKLEDVYDYGGDGLMHAWYKFRFIIPELRKAANPKMWEWWEYLAMEMERISDQRGDNLYGLRDTK